MSDRGQRIYKWIVWILIVVLSSTFVIRKLSSFEVKSTDSEYISQQEWESMLANGFGKAGNAEGMDSPSDKIIGEYAVISAMKAVGDDKLKRIMDKDEINDEDRISFALDNDVIKKKQLDDELTVEEANIVINNALDICFDSYTYPEYFDAEANTDVINANNWDISQYDYQNGIITASFDTVPEIGKVVMITDKYGITHANYVGNISSNGDQYDVELTKIEDMGEVLKTVSFSGVSDFGYLSAVNDDSSAKRISDRCSLPAINDLFVMTAHAEWGEIPFMEWGQDEVALRKEKGDDTKKCDIEIGVEIKNTDKNGERESSVSSNIKVGDLDESPEYKFEINDKGEPSLEIVKGNYSFGFEKNDKEGFLNDTSYIKDEDTISANVQIEGLTICTSGYYQWADPSDIKNYVEVMAHADKVHIDATFKKGFEDKYKIGSLPIPIAASAGTISIWLNIYLVVGADGEFKIWYEMEDPKFGINISTENGVYCQKDYLSEDAGISASVELNGGLIGEAAVMVCGGIDLADPGVDVRMYCSAATLDVADGYEKKPEYTDSLDCIELKAQAPVVKLTATAGEDSLLYALLDILKLEVSYDLIEKDTEEVRWRVTYHVEIDDDGTMKILKVPDEKEHEDICTHIRKKKNNPADDLEDQLEDELDKKAEEEKDKLNKKIDEFIEKWLEENCGDCT